MERIEQMEQMERMEEQIGVYVKTDQNDCIIEIGSSLFIQDTSGWILIDQGEGDRYAHAQGNYLPGPLRDERMRYRYKLVDGAAVERGPEELAAEVAPPQTPSLQERVEVMEAALLEMILGGTADD